MDTILAVFNHFARGEAYLFVRGILIIGSAMASSAGNDGRKTFRRQTEDLVVLCRIDSFHRTRIDTQNGRGRHKIAKSNLQLPRRPLIHYSVAPPFHDLTP